MANGDAGVVYTTKELLARIEDKVDRIDVKLDQKADRTRMHEFAGDLAAIHILLAGYTQHLLEFQSVKQQVDKLRYWKASIIGALLVLSTLASANGIRVWFG